MLKYYQNKYLDISFLIGLSNVDGKTARKHYEQRRGTPKIIIVGKEVNYHIHCVIIGKSAEEFVKNIVKRINKNAERSKPLGELKRRIPAKMKKVKSYANEEDIKIYNDKGMGIVPYVYKQSNPCFSYPKNGFNFKDLENGQFEIKQF